MCYEAACTLQGSSIPLSMRLFRRICNAKYVRHPLQAQQLLVEKLMRSAVQVNSSCWLQP